MKRFFIEKIGKNNKALYLSSEESWHAVKVLRIKEGSNILVYDSAGNEYEAKISGIESKEGERLKVQILNQKQKTLDQVHFHIAQGFLKKQKMDFLVEKACEIGIKSFIPLISEYTVARPKKDVLERIQNRWKRIITSAGKQSGNIQRMQLFDLSNFEEFISKTSNYNMSFIFHPGQEAISLTRAVENILSESEDCSSSNFNVLLMIGPEGGFSGSEIKHANQKGITVVDLGKRILRAETAFIAIAAIFRLLTK